MAIIPVTQDATGVETYHEERGHGGMVPWAAVRHGLQAGTRDYDRTVLVLPCPACGGETAHPVNEASPEIVRAVAAELGKRAPEGPRPATPEEQAEAADKGARATRLARLDQDIAGYGALDAQGRAAATLNGLIILRAVVRRLLGE